MDVKLESYKRRVPTCRMYPIKKERFPKLEKDAKPSAVTYNQLDSYRKTGMRSSVNYSFTKSPKKKVKKSLVPGVG